MIQPMKTLLLVTLFLPAAAAILAGLGRMQARCWALAASLATLVGAIVLAANSTSAMRHFAATDYPWFAAAGIPLDIRFSVALDGLSLWLFALTALLLVVAVLVSWEAIKDQQSLVLPLAAVVGHGHARRVRRPRHYSLLPVLRVHARAAFFLIGIWGSEQRRYAAIKFFLFTLAGSVLTLLGLLTIVLWDWHARRRAGDDVFHHGIDGPPASPPHALCLQVWLFLALFAGFAIKVPLFPLHTWLPLAHVEAPAAGSVLLAGVLLKIGTYGFLRFNLPMLPQATAAAMPCLLWLSVAGIIYGALVALAQSDLKRLIAYSSVSHLGFCMLGIFALNPVALQGGALQMINHGLSTGGLFALVGMIYERYHTRRIADFGGIARRDPRAGLLHALHDAGQHRTAGPQRLRGRVPLADGHVPAGLGSRNNPVDRAIPRHFRAGRQRRGAGGLVHAVADDAGLLRPPEGAETCRADRRPQPARGLGPGSLVPGHRLDRRAAEVLSRPHGPHHRPIDRPAMRPPTQGRIHAKGQAQRSKARRMQKENGGK